MESVMKHIGIAVVAAAVLALIGPRITPGYSQIEKTTPHSSSAANAAPAPTSMLRMRAGDEYPSRFDRR